MDLPLEKVSKITSASLTNTVYSKDSLFNSLKIAVIELELFETYPYAFKSCDTSKRYLVDQTTNGMVLKLNIKV